MYTSFFDFHAKIPSMSDKDRQMERVWFRLSLDMRAIEDWVHVVCWFHEISGESQQGGPTTTSEQISLPLQTGFIEEYPDDTLLSCAVSSISPQPIILDLHVKMKFYERDPLPRCRMFGNDSMFCSAIITSQEGITMTSRKW